MSLWQYNAWCEAYRDRMADQLSLQVQAEYLGAYWSSWSKHKKSLDSVLKQLRPKTKKSVHREPIDLDKVRNEFRQLEELKTNGWSRI